VSFSNLSTACGARGAHRARSSCLAALFAVLLLDCASTPGETKSCTAIGCDDGFTVAFSPDSGWKPGAYRFIIDIDGQVTTCEGALPLQACSAGPSLTCTPASARISLGESGCALPPEQHGFSGLRVGGSPVQLVSVTIGQDARNLVQKTFTPTYETSQPNGEGCEPVCNSASDSLAIPGAAP
jgi:hypothetical protein